MVGGKSARNSCFTEWCFLRFFDPRHTKIDFSRRENVFFVKFVKFYVENCGIERKNFFDFSIFLGFFENFTKKKTCFFSDSGKLCAKR